MPKSKNQYKLSYDKPLAKAMIKTTTKIISFSFIMLFIILLVLLGIGFLNQFRVTNDKIVLINNSNIINDKELIGLVDLTEDKYKENVNIVVIEKSDQLFELFLKGKVPLTFGQVLNYYFDKEREKIQGRTIKLKDKKADSNYWIFIFESNKVFNNSSTDIKQNAFVRILYHELRHVFQFKEEVDMVSKYKDIPYNEKPYEKDAEEYQLKFREENKSEIANVLRIN